MGATFEPINLIEIHVDDYRRKTPMLVEFL